MKKISLILIFNQTTTGLDTVFNFKKISLILIFNQTTTYKSIGYLGILISLILIFNQTTTNAPALQMALMNIVNSNL